jgi:hypothetical protein
VTFAGWVILAVALDQAAWMTIAVGCWCLGRKDGWEDGRDYQRSREYLNAIKGRWEARRARPVSREPWYQPVPPGPVPRPAPSRPRRVVTTAGDIPPVIVPAGATTVPVRPQPGRDSGAGTVTMPRVPALSDTGEIRMRAAEFIARIAAQEEEWRQSGLPAVNTDIK